jgi:hypothetical protein
MLRFLLVVALLAAPGAALARPMKAPARAEKVAVIPVTPQCTHVRRKSFHPAEGWSVKTASLVCKTVAAAAKQPGSQGFTSLRTDKTGKSK